MDPCHRFYKLIFSWLLPGLLCSTVWTTAVSPTTPMPSITGKQRWEKFILIGNIILLRKDVLYAWLNLFNKALPSYINIFVCMCVSYNWPKRLERMGWLFWGHSWVPWGLLRLLKKSNFIFQKGIFFFEIRFLKNSTGNDGHLIWWYINE